MMGSSSCLPAQEAFLRSSSLLCFLSSRTDECTGNGGPGLIEHSATTGRLGLGLLGLEGEFFGSSALLAHDCVEDFFLGLGQRRVRAEMARRKFARLGFGEDGRDSSVDSSCLRRRRVQKPCRTPSNGQAGAYTCSCTASGLISSQGSFAEPGLRRRRRELAPRGLLLRCYCRSTQVEELVLEVLPLPRLLHLASEF